MKMKWEDPPFGKGGKGAKGVMRQFVDELKSRPGTWAIYRECNTAGNANNSARAIKINYPGTEAVSRGCKAYARWVGDEDKP